MVPAKLVCECWQPCQGWHSLVQAGGCEVWAPGSLHGQPCSGWESLLFP